MRKLSFIALTVLLFTLTSCPGPDNIENVDLGNIPEQYFSTVPYADGDTFVLRHETTKALITYSVKRERFDEIYRFYNDEDDRFYNIIYQVDNTVCSPDRPVFAINLSYSNSFLSDLSDDTYAYLSCSRFVSCLPVIGLPCAYTPTLLSSVTIDERTYNDVFVLSNNYHDDYYMIAPVQVLYSYEKGVIAIQMSNGEKYVLYED